VPTDRDTESPGAPATPEWNGAPPMRDISRESPPGVRHCSLPCVMAPAFPR
jgi:hypothetical protein